MPIPQDIGKETKVQETKVQKTITYNHKKQSIDCVYYQNARSEEHTSELQSQR